MKSTLNTSADHFLSCDWGTSSFRLKLVDSATGEVQEAVTTSQGTQIVYNSWSETGKEQERERYYYQYLQENILKLERKTDRSLDGIPLIISGMASSSIGIKELPYSSLPISLKDPKLRLEIREKTADFPHKVILISGIRTDHDIMRGEETQLLGLAAGYDLENGICILPGTHSKHIFIENNTIVDFKTFMTGELFSLLSAGSILRNSVTPGTSVNNRAFNQGMGQALQRNILNSLFKIRAEEILYGTDPKKNYDFLSGLLIGTELAKLREYSSTRFFLVGESRLQQLYAMALTFWGLDHLSVKTADELTVDGHRHILNKIKP